MTATHPISVTIGGQRYVVKSDADETYVRTLAGYVDEKLEEVRKGARSLPEQKQLILSALNIADELLQERQKRTEFKRQVREQSEAVLTQIELWSKKHRKSRR